MFPGGKSLQPQSHSAQTRVSSHKKRRISSPSAKGGVGGGGRDSTNTPAVNAKDKKISDLSSVIDSVVQQTSKPHKVVHVQVVLLTEILFERIFSFLTT